MSGILGIFKINGEPVYQPELAKMMKAMEKFGTEGGDTWFEGAVGLGNQKLCITPESFYETMPMHSNCGNYILTANCRIDNREDLLQIFSIPKSEHHSTPDSFLIMEAYRKWRDNCCKHLIGDWGFAIWDKTKQELFIAKDHHGISSLYYMQVGNTFVFASSIKGLLALKILNEKPNDKIITKMLMHWNNQGEETAYKDIYRLLPSHHLKIKSGTTKIAKNRYWFLENSPSIKYKNDEEYIEQFLEIFTEAVNCRLRSCKPVGILLSGGLDSTAVGAIAVDKLKTQNKFLHSFTSIPQYDICEFTNKFGNEKNYVLSFQHYVGNTKTNYVTGSDTTLLRSIRESMDALEQPLFMSPSSAWMLSAYKMASKEVGTILSGGSGNTTISYHGKERIMNLPLKFQFKTLLQELQVWSKNKNCSVLASFRSLVVAPYLSRIKALSNPYRPLDNIQEKWFIAPSFMGKKEIYKNYAKQGYDPFFSKTFNSQANRYKVIKPGRHDALGLNYELTAQNNIDYRDPTIDKRVMEFCLNIPDDQYFYQGWDRSLIRKAMKNKLTNDIIYNTKKGMQVADLNKRVINSIPDIENTIKLIEKSEFISKYIHVAKLKNLIKMLKHNENYSNINSIQHHIAMIQFIRALGVGIFLHRFE